VHWTGHKSRCDRNLGKRFGVSAREPLERATEVGPSPISFKVDFVPLWRLANIKEDNPLYFTYCKDASLLKQADIDLSRKQVVGCYQLAAMWAPRGKAQEHEPCVVGRFNARHVRDTARYAATLAGRKPQFSNLWDVLRIAPGAATSGYEKGFSRCRSPLLPDNLSMIIPKAVLNNVLAALREMSGARIALGYCALG
jgi:hypothetical protein